MGLLNQSQRHYYQSTENIAGNYQFISLEDIVTQFQIAYVGENKIIPKIKRTDIAFHAQRALAELSFDTFKSIKAYQIDVPNTLTMMLPHDYVNYTKLSLVDSSGIKHPLYKTNSTSNPFEIDQHDNGSYSFGEEVNIVTESELLTIDTWSVSTAGKSDAWTSTYQNANETLYFKEYIDDTIGVSAGQLQFKMLWLGNNSWGSQGGSRTYGAWQAIDVSGSLKIDLEAAATSGARQTDGSGNLICDYGIVRIGISSIDPNVGWLVGSNMVTANNTHPDNAFYPSPNNDPSRLDLGYVEWVDGETDTKELLDIDVSQWNTVWVYIQTSSPWSASAVTLDVGGASGSGTAIDPTSSTNNTQQANSVDSVSVYAKGVSANLLHADEFGNSSTWNNYKSATPSENNDDNYEDDTYWSLDGNRYGLDPKHAQTNGSFYIDDRLGKIHFSSNISGKTVILDYISDSLGTDAEMQVHKFAEEAMYKCIAHAILSTSSYGQPLVPRLIKEKFAAVRKAKLRLSNIKLEELTQILRGKSKQIKH